MHLAYAKMLVEEFGEERGRKLILKAIPDGDECCELAPRPTTEKERKDFADKEADWEYVDKITEK